jgi:hypothetical protein
MKRSDTTMDTQTGQFVAGTTPLGTVTKAMVTKRAKEIAVINGRNGNDFTDDDYEQARVELTGFQGVESTEFENSAPDSGGWLGEAGDRGQKAPVRPAADEQTFAEDLVKQGVQAAAHDQMLAGSQTSVEKDKI